MKYEITPERRDEVCEILATRIARYGMIVPAIFFLEMNRPISFLGSQAMHFISPMVGVFVETFEDYAFFFEDRDNLDMLINRLEELGQEQEEEEKARKARLKAERQKKREERKKKKSQE